MSVTLEHAIRVAAQGLTIVPPRQDGTKAPDAQWKRYLTSPPDRAQLDAWYATGQRTGIGLVCGAVSGHLELLELEGRAIDLWGQFVQAAASHDAGDVLDRVVAGYAERTPSGGIHLLYRSQQPIAGNQKLARRPGPDGTVEVLLETRGEGGYVVVAPSNGGVHPTGGKWELISGGFDTITTLTADERDRLLAAARSLDQMPPPDVRQVPVEPHRTASPATGGESWMDATISAFNDATSWPGILGPHGWQHSHRHGDVDYWTRPGKEPRDGHSATTNANGTDRLIVFSSSVPGFRTADGDGPAPSYDRFGTYAVLHHGGDRLEAAKTANRDGHGPEFTPTPRAYEWADLLDQVPTHEPATETASAPPGEWPPPTALTGARTPPPGFPLHTLPKWIRAQAADVAHQMQVPIDLPALLSIGALATVIAGKVRLEVTAGWREHLNIYMAVAMPPSSGKSPAAKAMFAPIETLEADLGKLHQKTALEAAQRKAIAEKRAKDLETKAAKSGTTHDADAAVAAFIDAAETEVPKPPRYLSDDATPEALTAVLADNGGRITIASTEGGLFELMTGRYSDGRANLDVYLKAWSSDPIRVDRIGRPPVHIPEPVVTVALAVQPDVVQALADRPELAGRGLTARFMYALPEDLVGTRDLTTPRPATAHIRQTYNDHILNIGKRCSSWAVPADLQLDPTAGHRYGQWRQALEQRRRPDQDLRHVAEWTGKLEGTALRVAGLLHIADGGPPTGHVDDDTMARAIEIADYWLAHALEVHARWQIDTTFKDAQLVLDWMAKRTDPAVTLGELATRGPNPFRPKNPDGRARLITALHELLEHGWLRTDDGAEMRTEKSQGRTTQRLIFHPHTRAKSREAAPGDAITTTELRAASRDASQHEEA